GLARRWGRVRTLPYPRVPSILGRPRPTRDWTVGHSACGCKVSSFTRGGPGASFGAEKAAERVLDGLDASARYRRKSDESEQVVRRRSGRWAGSLGDQCLQRRGRPRKDEGAHHEEGARRPCRGRAPDDQEAHRARTEGPRLGDEPQTGR